MNGPVVGSAEVVWVLTNRVNAQRQEIAFHYKSMYGKDLISDLTSNLSGNFVNLVVALMTPTYDFLAKEIKTAVDGIGTDEETITEIICTASNVDVYNIRMAYQKLFGEDLEKVLMEETSGGFQRLLVSLIQGARSQYIIADVASAQNDAQVLLNADESTINMILCTRSLVQLQQVFEEFHHLTQKDFEHVLKKKFSGDIQRGFTTIVQFAKDKSAFFAKHLYDAMDGIGTNNRALIRIVSTRSEIDMMDIKCTYKSMYGHSLEDDIEDDTSGYYKNCLIALVGGSK